MVGPPGTGASPISAALSVVVVRQILVHRHRGQPGQPTRGGPASGIDVRSNGLSRKGKRLGCLYSRRSRPCPSLARTDAASR